MVLGLVFGALVLVLRKYWGPIYKISYDNLTIILR